MTANPDYLSDCWILLDNCFVELVTSVLRFRISSQRISKGEMWVDGYDCCSGTIRCSEV
jgi:hypothetical protein